MDAPRIFPVTALLAVLVLTACGSDEPEASAPTPTQTSTQTPTAAPVERAPSAECLEAMSTAADEIDPVLADPLIQETAYTCETGEEWEAALQEHPGAMGLTEQADLSGSLEMVCFTVPDAPACADVE